MSFIFNTAIPAAANDPSVDQPDMLTNNQSTNSILAVDHISFNTANGGNHLQVHLPQYTNPTVINGVATQGSVIYGAAGTADAAHAQCNFKTSNGTFPLSCVRAWGFISGGAGPAIIAGQAVNVASIVRNSAGVYTITLTANAVSLTNFAVFIGNTTTGGGAQLVGNYTTLGVDTFRIQFQPVGGGGFADPVTFTFQVLQI